MTGITSILEWTVLLLLWSLDRRMFQDSLMISFLKGGKIMLFSKKDRSVQQAPTNRRQMLRKVVGGGAAGALALAATATGVNTAHAETAIATGISNTVPLGAWSVYGVFLTRTGAGGINIPPDWGLCTFETSGTVTVVGSYITAGVGAWTPTASGKFSFSLVQQVYKGPNTQYVAGWTGNVIIYVQQATLASDGKSWSANAVARQFDQYGTDICDDTLSLTGTRISVGNLDTLPIQKFNK
jgi:hypothetical protein